MTEKEAEKYRIRAEIVKAMGHPARLFIMHQLSQHKLSVNDLQAQIGTDVSTVSKHLSVLKKAGILNAKKEGTQVYYSLKVPCIMNFMDCVETLIKENALEHLSSL